VILLKRSDGLRLSVLEDLKAIAGQPFDWLAVMVENDHVNQYDLNSRLEGDMACVSYFSGLRIKKREETQQKERRRQAAEIHTHPKSTRRLNATTFSSGRLGKMAVHRLSD
jgi:hypothetical protein